MDDILDADIDDEEIDEATGSILDEIGLDISEQMSKAKTPNSKLPGSATKTTTMNDKDLEQLLNSI